MPVRMIDIGRAVRGRKRKRRKRRRHNIDDPLQRIRQDRCRTRVVIR